MTQRPLTDDRAAALVITLFVIALLTILVVTFFSMAGTARKSSHLHADAASLQNLKDTAISLAIAQVRDGTSREDELWTSQPGAIRTFDQTAGTPSRIYKLYSHDEMVVDATRLAGPEQLSLEGDAPSDWQRAEGAFVDLNEPVFSTFDEDLHFPIVDPRLYDGEAGPASSTPEGFAYRESHVITGGGIDGIAGPGAGPESQRLPMPVKWLYQLEDGTLGTLGANGKFQPITGSATPTHDNPMVGRLAFWTDDESAKINLNTASEAIPWDTPRAATPEDVENAHNTPVRNEVQRFGGHPASTCLSSVFFPNQDLDPSGDLDKFTAIYDLVPRVAVGGLIEASRDPVAFDDDRLFASVDEALLRPDRSESSLFEKNGTETLRRARFLLTANSRAPEVTAAGTPRICLWPVSWRETDVYRTAFDQLITFNSVIGDRPYLFRRHGGLTNIGEYNTFYVKTGNDPLRRGLTSNADLFDYLEDLGRTPRHGYPISLREKYTRRDLGTGFMSFLEYCRQTNLYDTTLRSDGQPIRPYGAGGNRGNWGTEIYGQVTNVARNHLSRSMQSALRQPGQYATNGIGRIYLPSEVGLALLLAAEHRPDGSKYNEPLVTKLKLPIGTKALQLAPIAEAFNPAQGYAMAAPSSSFKMDNLNSIRIRGSKGSGRQGGVVTSPGSLAQATLRNPWGHRGGLLHTPSMLRELAPGGDSMSDWWVGWGGSGGRALYVGHDTHRSTHMTSHWRNPSVPDFDDPNRRLRHQYSRGFYLVPSTDRDLQLSSGLLRFRISDQRNGAWINTLRFRVPSGTRIPVPEKPAELDGKTWGERYLQAAANDFESPEILDPSDVVRTWVSRHGDYRLHYVREIEGGSLPSSKRLMVPHPNWDPSNTDRIAGAENLRQIHAFVASGGVPEGDLDPLNPSFRRGLVRGVDYPTEVTPDFVVDPDNDATFRANLPGYPYALDPTVTRDWDNGTGIAPDGAYWNKVDDIAHRSDSTSRPPYFSRNVWDGVTDDTVDQTSAPNQQIPSAVMLGSINSAAATGAQWTTYLFRPDITPGGHLGARDQSLGGPQVGAPPDHTLLDFFWMPVVQPYAISERFSTAGKVNLNYRIAPFSYIQRATGLHAVMKSERLLAIPTAAGQVYKNYAAHHGNTGWRHRIDADETLRQFEEKFDAGEVFRTESEICEQFLVPRGESLDGMQAFWDAHRLTGDNSLERPYANLYPRLTTRSNTYRIHCMVQTLQKSRQSDPETFDPLLDYAIGEYRGEALIERAIDPNDPDIPDYIDDFDAPRLDQFYAYRILYTRKFAP